MLFQAIADSIILLKLSIDYNFKLLVNLSTNYTMRFEDLSTVTCYSSSFILLSLQALTVFLTLFASIDRYMSMRKPYERFSGNLITYRYPILISTISFFIILALRSPDFIVNLNGKIFTEDRYKTVKNSNKANKI